jgi:hypothetical protein
MDQPEQKEMPNSYIQILFSDMNSVEFVPNISGVTPLQLFAIAEYLRLMGQKMFLEALEHQEETARRNKIVVPGMK